MPNFRAHDQNYVQIEVAIKETAPGRAFLAEYARRVRQSDTLTLLPMIGRLERACQDLAVRLAEPNGRVPVPGCSKIESPPASPVPKSDIYRTLPVAGEFAGDDQNREALKRIAHLVDVLRNLDRLTNRPAATSACPETSLLADTAAVKRGGEIPIVPSAEIDESERLFPSAPDRKRHHPEEGVLGDIAKALRTIA